MVIHEPLPTISPVLDRLDTLSRPPLPDITSISVAPENIITLPEVPSNKFNMEILPFDEGVIALNPGHSSALYTEGVQGGWITDKYVYRVKLQDGEQKLIVALPVLEFARSICDNPQAQMTVLRLCREELQNGLIHRLHGAIQFRRRIEQKYGKDSEQYRRASIQVQELDRQRAVMEKRYQAFHRFFQLLPIHQLSQGAESALANNIALTKQLGIDEDKGVTQE